MIDKTDQLNSQDTTVTRVQTKGRFRTDRFGLPIGHHDPIVDAVRQLPNMPANLTNAIAQRLLRYGSDLHVVGPLFALGAYAPDSADRQRRQELLYVLGLPPSIHAVYFPTFGIMPGDPTTLTVRTIRTTDAKESWDFGEGSAKVEVQSDGDVVPLDPAGGAEELQKVPLGCLPRQRFQINNGHFLMFSQFG